MIYQLAWDGRDNRGKRVSSGIYFVRLEHSHGTDTERMVLLR